MKKCKIALSLFLLSACGNNTLTPIYDPTAGPIPDIEHFPGRYDPHRMANEVSDDLQDSDSREIRACKVAAAKYHGANYFRRLKPMNPTIVEDCENYVSFAMQNWESARQTAYGMHAIAYEYMLGYIDDNGNPVAQPAGAAQWNGRGVYLNSMGMPGIKTVHAKGKHQCWSKAVIGYTCNVENRNYNDCDTAVRALQNTNCCKIQQSDGVSNGYIHGSCF